MFFYKEKKRFLKNFKMGKIFVKRRGDAREDREKTSMESSLTQRRPLRVLTPRIYLFELFFSEKTSLSSPI